MNTTSIKTALIAASAAAAIGLAAAPAALADDEGAVTTATIGQQARADRRSRRPGLDHRGTETQHRRHSYTPQGTLWEATATNQTIEDPSSRSSPT